MTETPIDLLIAVGAALIGVVIMLLSMRKWRQDRLSQAVYDDGWLVERQEDPMRFDYLMSQRVVGGVFLPPFLAICTLAFLRQDQDSYWGGYLLLFGLFSLASLSVSMKFGRIAGISGEAERIEDPKEFWINAGVLSLVALALTLWGITYFV